MDEKAIEKLVEAYFSENELSDCYFINCKISNGNKIEVFIDKDGGIKFGECQKLSRNLEAIFDEKQTFGEKYTLEVSSPGVGSPLKKLRQYHNNVGRTIEVKTSEEKIKGILTSVTDESITVSYEIVVKEGKKKKKETENKNILFNNILEAKIKVSFK
jgi:ribosome maturation factor RimP